MGMLCLTRKPNESIFIGDNIIVKVLSIKGNVVRFGVTAPKDVAVDREEIAYSKAMYPEGKPA